MAVAAKVHTIAERIVVIGGMLLEAVVVIEVPMDQLSAEVVRGLIEEFVTRHGAIQGEDTALDVKRGQVERLLKSGKAAIVWDEESETATIVLREEMKKWDGRRIERDPDDGGRQMKDEW